MSMPGPIPEPEDDYVVEAEVLAGHCPTGSCPSTSDHWEPYTWPDQPSPRTDQTIEREAAYLPLIVSRLSKPIQGVLL